MPAVRRPVLPARGRTLILLLGVLTALSPLATDLYLPAFPAMARELHASAASVQLTLTAYLIGAAVAQLAWGPAADAYGRRRPMIACLAGFAVLTAACAVSPSVGVLVPVRFAQGCIASGSMVLVRATTRDLHSGAAMARFMSHIMLIVGAVPILAPTAGGQLLALLDWRGIFAVLTVVVLVGTMASVLLLPETLPAARRRPAGPRQVWGATRSVLADRVFVGATLTAGFAFGALLVYISDSAFVFEKVHGLSAQAFGLLFGVNALFLIGATQVNARVVQRVEPDLLVGRALPVMLAGAALLFVPALLPGLGLVALLPPIWLMLASLGFVTANAVVIALEPHGEAAGTASAVLGAVQFGLGSLLGPLTGLLGHDSAVPLAALLVLCVGCALLLHRFVTRPALRAAGA